MRNIIHSFEDVPVNALRQHPRNPNEGDIGAIIESIDVNGFFTALTVQRTTGYILAGNHRYMAACHAGATTVPVLWVDVDDTEALKIMLADNRIAEKASRDVDLLAAILEELARTDPEHGLDGTGYDGDDLDQMIQDLAAHAPISGAPAEVKEDDLPDAPKTAITKPGDLWHLGRHRLLCGDATVDASYGRLLGGLEVDAVITDPPYGIDYKGKHGTAREHIAGDTAAELHDLLTSSLSLALGNCKPGGAWYVAAPPGPELLTFGQVLARLGVWRQTLIWAKQLLVLGWSDFHYQHETLFYGWKPGANHQAPPDRSQTSLWQFDRPTTSKEHPTMKPVTMFAHMMAMSTNADALVLDPFAGSGTTIIAAEQCDRTAFSIELNPHYCDVIVKRWESLTGKVASRNLVGGSSKGEG